MDVAKYIKRYYHIIADIMQVPEEVQKKVDSLGGMERIMERLPGKQELERDAEKHRALSDIHRLKILHLLSAAPLCVCLIKSSLGIPDSRLSYHLSVLKDAGLIEGKREKSWIIYRITEKGRRCIGA